jgi:hypothetical protein
MAALTRSGARNASEIVMFTFLVLQLSRLAMLSLVAVGSLTSSSSQRRPRAIEAISVARFSERIGRRFRNSAPSGKITFTLVVETATHAPVGQKARAPSPRPTAVFVGDSVARPNYSLYRNQAHERGPGLCCPLGRRSFLAETSAVQFQERAESVPPWEKAHHRVQILPD